MNQLDCIMKTLDTHLRLLRGGHRAPDVQDDRRGSAWPEVVDRQLWDPIPYLQVHG